MFPGLAGLLELGTSNEISSIALYDEIPQQNE
jgi:hypothetical protein